MRILFFGATRDAVGKNEIDWPLASELTIGEILSHVSEEFPSLENHKLLFAINQEYSTGDEVLQDSDELAVFTAVSGG